MRLTQLSKIFRRLRTDSITVEQTRSKTIRTLLPALEISHQKIPASITESVSLLLQTTVLLGRMAEKF